MQVRLIIDCTSLHAKYIIKFYLDGVSQILVVELWRTLTYEVLTSLMKSVEVWLAVILW